MSERDANGGEHLRRWPGHDDRKFYIQRGIPLVPMVAFLLALGVQTVLGVRYISALEAEVKANSKAQTELVGKVDKIETKLELMNNTVQQGNVPAALNQRAIAELERQVSQILAKVSDNERRLSLMEVRNRANARER